MIYAIGTKAETTMIKRLLRTTKMKTLRCIIDNILNGIRNEDIRSIREIQDITRWARIRRRTWRDHVNGMDDKSGLQKWQKMGN